MDVAALILAIVAGVLFALLRRHPDLLGYGLVALTAALICQYVHLTGHPFHVN